jgi:hypothetical protein
MTFQYGLTALFLLVMVPLLDAHLGGASASIDENNNL